MRTPTTTPAPSRRGLAIGLLAGVSTMFGWAAACGLPQDGLSSRLDDAGATSPDATHPTDSGSGHEGDGEAAAPPACTSVDAACLGTLPQGWQPVAIGDGGCAQGYTTLNRVTNPRLNDGGCACGACQVLGAFDCNAMVAVSGGDGCGDPTLVTLTPGTCGTAQAQHVEAHPPAATGSVGCFAASDAGTGVVTDAITLCVPGCAVDYCQATQRCIAAAGDLPCPAGFTQKATVGTGADPGCAACACEAGPPGTCTGNITVYDNASCADSSAAVTYPVGACNQFSTTNNYESLLVQLTAPAPTCAASMADIGDASLTGVTTLCCQ